MYDLNDPDTLEDIMDEAEMLAHVMGRHPQYPVLILVDDRADPVAGLLVETINKEMPLSMIDGYTYQAENGAQLEVRKSIRKAISYLYVWAIRRITEEEYIEIFPQALGGFRFGIGE